MLGTKHPSRCMWEVSPNPEWSLSPGDQLWPCFLTRPCTERSIPPNSRKPSLALPPMWALLAHSPQRELQNIPKVLPSALWSTQRHKAHLQEQRLRVLQAGFKVITSTCSLSHHPDLSVYRKRHKGLFLIAITLGED